MDLMMRLVMMVIVMMVWMKGRLSMRSNEWWWVSIHKTMWHFWIRTGIISWHCVTIFYHTNWCVFMWFRCWYHCISRRNGRVTRLENGCHIWRSSDCLIAGVIRSVSRILKCFCERIVFDLQLSHLLFQTSSLAMNIFVVAVKSRQRKKSREKWNKRRASS